MARLPEVQHKKLWKLPRLSPGAIYAAVRESPSVVLALENGSRVLQRVKVTPDETARYIIKGGWIVEETYPASSKREEDEALASRAARAARGKVNRVAAGTPAFKALLAELAAALGPAEKRRVLDVNMQVFPAPRTPAKVAHWISRAREAGGAAALYADHTGRTLHVVPGRVSRLGALLGEQAWWGDRIADAFDALDDDAGLTIAYASSDGGFQLVLERVPRKPAAHAKPLAKLYWPLPSSKTIVAALRKRILSR